LPNTAGIIARPADLANLINSSALKLAAVFQIRERLLLVQSFGDAASLVPELRETVGGLDTIHRQRARFRAKRSMQRRSKMTM
jgi:hypothetical protein